MYHHVCEVPCVLHFEPSLAALSQRSDVISSIKILSLRTRGPHQVLSRNFICLQRLRAKTMLAQETRGCQRQQVSLFIMHRQRLFVSLVPSSRALSGHFKFTVRRHKFNEDSLPDVVRAPYNSTSGRDYVKSLRL